jgi:hypothetical protein
LKLDRRLRITRSGESGGFCGRSVQLLSVAPTPFRSGGRAATTTAISDWRLQFILTAIARNWDFSVSACTPRPFG